MGMSEFLVIASLFSIIFHGSVIGQSSEIISQPRAVAETEKMVINFDDLVIEVTAPRGREDTVNTKAKEERLIDMDDLTYWESIYGKIKDVPDFDEYPIVINGKPVEFKYVTSQKNEHSNEKFTETSDKEKSDASMEKHEFTDDLAKASTKKISRISRDSDQDRCERTNPLYPIEKSTIRRKRQSDDSTEDVTETPDSNWKQQFGIISMMQKKLKKLRKKLDSISNYLSRINGNRNKSFVNNTLVETVNSLMSNSKPIAKPLPNELQQRKQEMKKNIGLNNIGSKVSGKLSGLIGNASLDILSMFGNSGSNKTSTKEKSESDATTVEPWPKPSPDIDDSYDDEDADADERFYWKGKRDIDGVDVDETTGYVETSLRSALGTNAENKVYRSLNEPMSTGSDKNIDSENSPTHVFLNEGHDREFRSSRRDEFENQRNDEESYPGKYRYRDYNKRYRSAIHPELNIDSYSNDRHFHPEMESSMNVDSHLDIERAESRTHGGNRQYNYRNSEVDSFRINDSGENTKNIRKFSSNPFLREPIRSFRYPGVHSTIGIHESPVTGVAMDERLHENPKVIVPLAHSPDAETHRNFDAHRRNFHSRTGTSANSDDSRIVGDRSDPRASDEGYRPRKRKQDISAGHNDYNHEREYARMQLERQRTLPRGSPFVVQTDDRIRSFHDDQLVTDAIPANSPPKAIKSPNVRYLSAVDAENHEDSGFHEGSIIREDFNGPVGKSSRKNGKAVDQGRSPLHSLGHDDHHGAKIQGAELRESFEVCEKCGRPMYGETPRSCAYYGKNVFVSEDGQPHSAGGTACHLDDPKDNNERVAEPTRVVEPQSNNPDDDHRCPSFNSSFSDEAFRRNSDLRDSDRESRKRRGFVRDRLNRDTGLDMHDRIRSLSFDELRWYRHNPSTLFLHDENISDDSVEPNEKSGVTFRETRHELPIERCSYNPTAKNFLEFLNNHRFRITGRGNWHDNRKPCNRFNVFRSFDGRCNNIDNPAWGQSETAFARILPPRYSDGIHEMPVSVTGAELPNPRELSVRLYSRRSIHDPELTLAVVQWGQTVAHDLGRQIVPRTASGDIACCDEDGKYLPKILRHNSCAPITISPDDKFYSSYGQRCMNFTRTMTVSGENSSIESADQINGATSFLDCSFMYGSDEETSNELREFTGGRMKLELRSGRWMLPTTTNCSYSCHISTPDDACYRTGDFRNNQNPQLAILQTLLVREHNRVADELSVLNKNWNDQRIFQESRRIVIAEYQHITYNEWLPLLLGSDYAKTRGVIRPHAEMSDAYNERVDPTTVIGFTSGAFRSLHSMIEGDIGLWDVRGNVVDNLKLSDYYSRPKIIESNDNFEHLLRGLVAQRMQVQDMNWHEESTEYLFRRDKDYGMDLAAIDIQRGRDHGLPGYNAYRGICQLKIAKNFDDLSDDISLENIEKLRRNYAHVDDIDLIIGATMEYPASGSKFGPTNRCLIGEQFYRTRVGDRYFYDNANFRHSFTPEQFHEITKATLSRILCDLGGAITAIQVNAFRAASSENPSELCENLSKMNLIPWTER